MNLLFNASSFLFLLKILILNDIKFLLLDQEKDYLDEVTLGNFVSS
jgi:hypothetical protein